MGSSHALNQVELLVTVLSADRKGVQQAAGKRILQGLINTRSP
jgi:hypothetical protein